MKNFVMKYWRMFLQNKIRNTLAICAIVLLFLAGYGLLGRFALHLSNIIVPPIAIAFFGKTILYLSSGLNQHRFNYPGFYVRVMGLATFMAFLRVVFDQVTDLYWNISMIGFAIWALIRFALSLKRLAKDMKST